MKTSDFRKQAHKIAKTGKPAKIVWSELKSWASVNGPLAMKAAVMEFVHAYRGSSEIATLLPELMRSTPFTSHEQKSIIKFINPKPELLERPSHDLAPRILAPSIDLRLNPRTRSSLLYQEFNHDPRQDIFMMKERSMAILERPKSLEGRWDGIEKQEIKSYSMAMDRKHSHGVHLIRHLTEHVRSHSADPKPAKDVAKKAWKTPKKISKTKPAKQVKKQLKPVKKKVKFAKKQVTRARKKVTGPTIKSTKKPMKKLAQKPTKKSLRKSARKTSR